MAALQHFEMSFPDSRFGVGALVCLRPVGQHHPNPSSKRQPMSADSCYATDWSLSQVNPRDAGNGLLYRRANVWCNLLAVAIRQYRRGSDDLCN